MTVSGKGKEERQDSPFESLIPWDSQSGANCLSYISNRGLPDTKQTNKQASALGGSYFTSEVTRYSQNVPRCRVRFQVNWVYFIKGRTETWFNELLLGISVAAVSIAGKSVFVD